jgi:hypothetical protein
MTKKKKKSNTPKWKALKQPQRLSIAKDWIDKYKGKNLVRGYAKHFATDLLCAIKELRMLGVTVTAGYEEDVKRAITDRAEQNRKKKEALQLSDDNDGLQDESFAFIAGYTEGAVPFGVTWAEMQADTPDLESGC